MAKKHAKEESLDFFYLNNKKEEKRATKTRPTKQGKKKKVSNKKAKEESNVFDFDNEIVIGVNVIPDQKDKPTSTKKKVTTKKAKVVPKKQVTKKQENKKTSSTSEAKKKQMQSKKKKNSKLGKRIAQMIILFILITGALVFLFTTPLFNVTQIEVVGNEEIDKETIQSLSNIQVGENTFRYGKSKVVQAVKQNPYIETVEVQRNLPGKIVLKVKERRAKYIIPYGNGYIYLNSQGYILEISDTKIEVPIIKGFTTKEEDFVLGKRLSQEDLEKLEMILKIMEAATSNEIANLITSIDVTDKNNYTLSLETEGKTVYLGDASNLNSRMLALKKMIESEKGKQGEVFLKTDDKKTFREKV